jgi:tetraacyldisaccharide 4'-kinase
MSLLEQYANRVIHSRDRRILTRVILFPLSLLSLLYRVGVQIRFFLYDHGILKKERLPCTVISVGNITVGGTGKTPVVQYLARFLTGKGRKPVILSRGYKGKVRGKVQVLSGSTGPLPGWEEAGDEPFLLAKKLKTVAVVVGKDRVYAGRHALRMFSPDTLLLDDGFQHLKMERDIDIVVIDVQNGFGNGSLLPRGTLREPLKSLARADLILLNKGSIPDDYRKLEQEVRMWNGTAPVFYSSYRAESVWCLKTGEKHSPEFLKGKKLMAFSGIANPRYFHLLLTRLGAEVISHLPFPDHHSYTAQDLPCIMQKSQGSDLIITTEKDGVKLKQKVFENLPLFMLEVSLEVSREKEFQDCLLNMM